MIKRIKNKAVVLSFVNADILGECPGKEKRLKV